MNQLRSTQFELARHLRQPHVFAAPAWTTNLGLAMYQQQRQQQLAQSLSSVFSRCKSLLGDERWHSLVAHFHFSWHSHGHRESQLFDAFVNFLKSLPEVEDLPLWLADLASFEWALWAAPALQAPTPPSTTADLEACWHQPLQVNPTLQSLHLDWPVHQLSAFYQPMYPVHTVLWVLRDAADQIQVVEGDLVSTQLLSLIQSGMTVHEALAALAHWCGHEDPTVFAQEARALVEVLWLQEVLQSQSAAGLEH